MTVFPPGVDLSFKQLVNALLYKCKYAKHQLSDLTEPELDGLDRKLHIAASAIRGFRNATQKINQLPPELIFNILGYAQQSYSYLPLASFLPDLNAYEDHGREWYSLLHVCRLWRGIIARSPELWSTVDNTIIDEEEDKNNVAHDRYLVRSRATPLTVYVGVRDKKIRKKSLETLLKHVARFKEFHLVADLWEEDPFHTPIYSLLSSAAPNLLSLTLRTDGKDVLGGVLPSVFDGDMPQLREVTLEHFTSWPPSYFHNLTALSLSDQAFNRPTTLAFLDFLENSSHTLEILALVRAGPTLSWNTDVLPASADRLVRFPKMRQVSLGGWPSTATVSRFLSYISLPPETDLFIWGSVFSNPDTDLTTLLPEDTSNLHNIEAINKWYLTHYSVAQPADVLYVPFTAIVGSNNITDKANDITSGGSALHNYGVFRSSQLLATLPRYPLNRITSFVLRDSSYQTNRFRTAVWMEIFEKLVNLEELRILAYQSTTTTRSVLTALLPVGVVAPKDRKGKEEDKHMDNKLGGQELRTSAHDYSRMETAEVDSETDLDSPLLGDHSNCKILCPKLSSLGVEHDPDLASIFMTKLVKSRKQHGCPISKVVILVYDPQYGSPSSPRPRSSSRHSQDHNQQLTNHNTTNNHNTAPNGGLHGATGANPGAAGAMYTPSARSSVSSWAILNDEYNLRSREDEELLRKYVKEVRFEYKQPLSQDLVPKGWPTDAYRRTCLPYSF